MKFKLLFVFLVFLSKSIFCQIDSVSIKKADVLIESYYDVAYNKPDSALIILDSVEQLSKRINYFAGVTSAIRLRGMFYSERSEYVKSMSLLINALKEDEKIKNDDGIGMDYLYLGLNYFHQEKMNEALIYMKKAQRKYTEIKDEAGVTLVNSNIGMVYRNLDQFDTALTYYFKVRDYYQQENIHKNLARVENNIGNIYKDLKQYDKALEHFKLSESITLKSNDKYYLINVWCNVADVYVEKKEFQKAIDSYLKALQVAKEQKSVRLQKDVHFDLANAFEQKGDLANAYKNFKAYSNLKDSTISEKYNQDLADMEVKYSSQKKEGENNILKKENELQEVKILQEKKQKMLFASIAILVFIAGSVVFKQYKNKQKLNFQLSQINEKVNNQNITLRTLNTELIVSEENLTKANATKDQLISMLSHDLYNPITSVINYSGQIVEKMEKMEKEELSTSFLKVNNAVIPLQDLLDNILQWARIQKKQIVANIEQVDANVVLGEIIQLYKPGAEFKNVKMINSFTENGLFLTDRLMIYFILRNILNNAVKFSTVDTEIRVDTIRNGNNFCISVKDQGKGFSEDILKQLNSDAENTTTVNNHGTGVGLSISRQFVKLMNAKIEFKNRAEGGAEVVLIIQV